MIDQFGNPIFREMTLGDIARSDGHGFVDGPFGSNLPASEYTSSGIPVVRGCNLSLGIERFCANNYVFVSEETANRLSRSLCRPDDIIFTKKGTLGQTGIVPRNEKHKVFLLSSNQMKLSVDTTIAIPLFVYYYFSSPVSRERIIREAMTTGVPKINLTYLRQFPILLPPLYIQDRIVDILSAYEDLIENNTRQIKILEEMAQLIYREWFVNFRFPGHEQVKMVDSQLGLIPEGWEVKELGEIAQEIRRSVEPDRVDPNTPYFGLEHLPRKSIALSTWGTASQVQSTKLAFKKGEILFGKIRPYFHKVGIAPTDGVCSSDAIVINAIDSKNFPLVLACVSSENFINHATKTSQGTKMPRANWQVLIKYLIAVPPPLLLNSFNDLMQAIIEQIQIIVFENKNLRQTRDLLLPKLISGEINLETLKSPELELWVA